MSRTAQQQQTEEERIAAEAAANEEAGRLADADADDDTPEEIERARNRGWVPEAEFRGERRPRVFLSAKQFLAREKDDARIAIERSRHLDDKFAAQGRELAGAKEQIGTLTKAVEETKELVAKTHEMGVAAAKRAYDNAVTRITQERDQAIASGDAQGAAAAATRLAETERAKPAEPEAPAARRDDPPAPRAPAQDQEQIFNETLSKLDPDTQAFIRENRGWYLGKPHLQAFMIDQHLKILDAEKAESTGLTPREMLAEAKQKVVDRFPEEFGVNPLRSAAPSVRTPTPPGGGRRAGKKTWDDLPDDDKKAYNEIEPGLTARMSKQAGKPVKYTREMFLTEYQWE